MDLFAAGSETTSTTLRWALLFLVLNPKVQVSSSEAIHLVRMLDLRYMAWVPPPPDNLIPASRHCIKNTQTIDGRREDRSLSFTGHHLRQTK
jgi:hypothetical protein